MHVEFNAHRRVEPAVVVSVGLCSECEGLRTSLCVKIREQTRAACARYDLSCPHLSVWVNWVPL